MEKREINIQVSEIILNNLEKVFTTHGEASSGSLQMEEVLTVALEQWFSTIFGGRRYRSLTELYLEWLRELFAIPTTLVEPSEQILYSDFNFPYGQAAYLARVLRESQPRTLRIKFLDELRSVLQAREKEINEWIKDGRGEERLTLQISKSARRELDYVLGSLAREGKAVHPLRTEGTLGDFVAVLVVAHDVSLLIERLRGIRAELLSA